MQARIVLADVSVESHCHEFRWWPIDDFSNFNRLIAPRYISMSKCRFCKAVSSEINLSAGGKIVNLAVSESVTTFRFICARNICQKLIFFRR